MTPVSRSARGHTPVSASASARIGSSLHASPPAWERKLWSTLRQRMRIVLDASRSSALLRWPRMVFVARWMRFASAAGSGVSTAATAAAALHSSAARSAHVTLGAQLAKCSPCKMRRRSRERG